jgi:hypothetical protein
MSVGPGPAGAPAGGAPPAAATSPATIAAAMGASTPPPGAPAPGPPMSGPSPAAAGPSPASPYADLPADLPPHYQLVDVADRYLKQAIATGGFYREPEVLAAIRHHQAGLAKLIAAYARGGGKGPLEAPAVTTSVDQGDLAGDGDDHGAPPAVDDENVDLE